MTDPKAIARKVKELPVASQFYMLAFLDLMVAQGTFETGQSFKVQSDSAKFAQTVRALLLGGTPNE